MTNIIFSTMKNNFFKKKMNVENTTFLETDTRYKKREN